MDIANATGAGVANTVKPAKTSATNKTVTTKPATTDSKPADDKANDDLSTDAKANDKQGADKLSSKDITDLKGLLAKQNDPMQQMLEMMKMQQAMQQPQGGAQVPDLSGIGKAIGDIAGAAKPQGSGGGGPSGGGSAPKLSDSAGKIADATKDAGSKIGQAVNKLPEMGARAAEQFSENGLGLEPLQGLAQGQAARTDDSSSAPESNSDQVEASTEQANEAPETEEPEQAEDTEPVVEEPEVAEEE